jgi:alpha-mannosidase
MSTSTAPQPPAGTEREGERNVGRIDEIQGVVIEAVKPADDGDGTIVRVRECDGVERNVALRCGGRIGTVLNVDANERTVAGDVRVDGEIFAFVMPTLSTRLFRVRP